MRGERPPVVTIPVRFHLYWAGSDRDGAIAGFYWAVTETLATPPEGEIRTPPLPGPKPQDYHFTTKSDSTFIFRVAEDVPDRRHAFFIYAVDNLGKPDPTPARFIFNAFDQFPPIPIFLEAKGTGTIYELGPGGVVTARILTVNISDIDRRDTLGTVPRDTVPSGATLFFKWTAHLQVPGTVVTGWRYKLDEPEMVRVPASVTSVTYHSNVPPDTIPVLTGTKVFRLRAVDQAEGSSDSTRRFRLNFSPDTWFAGPDLNSPSFQTNPTTGVKYVSYTQGIPPGGIVGSLLSRDSVELLPALRPERRTFFEVWNDTLYARQERDTVHMNSIVILHGGGFDRDSRYAVNVDDIFRLPPKPRPVLEPGPANGSPVGFRWAISMAMVPEGFLQPAFSNVFPFFNPNSFLDYPKVGAYQPMFQTGKAYATLRAEDGDGDDDARIQNARLFAEGVDANEIPDPAGLRKKIIVFYVNYPPYFLANSGTFFPHPGDTITGTPWQLRFDGDDVDPYEAGRTVAGSRASSTSLRLRVTVRGLKLNGDSLITDPTETIRQPQVTIGADKLAELATGPALVTVQLCDCLSCETVNGQGRCVVLNIPIYYQRLAPNRPTSSNVNAGRPGLDPPTSRSER